jgi:hypothetical protein
MAKPVQIKSSEACVSGVHKALDVIDNAEFALTEKELTAAIRKGLNKATEPTRFKDMFLEAIINGYLSGFGTPIANAISIGVQNFTAPTLEAIGAMTDALRLTNRLRDESGNLLKPNRELRDAVAMFEAALEGFGADVMFFKQGWKSGYPLDINRSSASLARQLGVSTTEARKVIIKEIAAQKAAKAFADPQNTSTMEQLTKGFEKQITKEGLKPDEFEAYMDEAYDYISGHIPAKFGGKVIRWPTRATVAIDEYGKARFRRQKIAQMASLKAREDEAKGIGSYRELYNKYRKDALKIVDEGKAGEMEDVFGKMKMDIGRVFGQGDLDMTPYSSVKEFALRQTFQSPLFGAAKAAQDIRRDHAFVAYFVPFIKTPWNILKEGVSFVPGAGYVFRPGYLKGADPIKMSNDELLPRQILGASLFAGVGALYASGNVTGAPKNADEAQAWKDQGIQPFSIKIGDSWVSYQRIEPIATVLGLAADLMRVTDEYVQNPDMDKSVMDEAAKPILVAMKSNILSKSFMEGFSNILEVMSDPARYMESFAASGLRPLSPAVLNMVARASDPYERLATTPLEKLEQRFPFLRQQLPVEYGAIGGPRETNFAQAITGFGITSGPETELQQELARLNYTKGRVGDTIMRVGLNTEQLGEFRKMSAEMLTPVLDRFINSATYRNATDPRRKVLLEKVTNSVQSKIRNRYFAQLRRQDPEVARKFYNQEILKRGLEEQRPLR